MIGIGTTFLDYEYYQIVDYPCALYDMYTTLFNRKPRPYKPYLNMLLPFTVEVWMGYIAIPFAVAFTFVVIKYFEGQRDRSQLTIQSIGLISILFAQSMYAFRNSL